MAIDMQKERLCTKEEAVMRVTPSQLDELLHPTIDPKAEAKIKPIGKGLPAGPGGAVGQIVFTAADAVKWFKDGKKVILVREETNPEDVEGMRAAVGILTARGGMTSHAALVARGWGKCCVVGCAGVEIEHGWVVECVDRHGGHGVVNRKITGWNLDIDLSGKSAAYVGNFQVKEVVFSFFESFF